MIIFLKGIQKNIIRNEKRSKVNFQFQIRNLIKNFKILNKIFSIYERQSSFDNGLYENNGTLTNVR